MLLVSKTRRC